MGLYKCFKMRFLFPFITVNQLRLVSLFFKTNLLASDDKLHSQKRRSCEKIAVLL